METILIDDLAALVSYNRCQSDWDILLKKCLSVLSSGQVFIDEMVFQQSRYGFDPNQARTDMQAVNAALLMQKAIRKFLAKTRQIKLMKTPGYAMATGVFIVDKIYLVYLLKASRDQR